MSTRYNYDTKKHETGSLETDEDALKYLPKGAARELYKLLREHKDMSILDAYESVMDRVVEVKRD